MIRAGLQILAFIIIGMGLYYIIQHIEHKAITYHGMNVYCTPHIAPETRNEIKQFCLDGASLKNPSTWITQLKKQFPIINTVRLIKEPNDTLKVEIDGHTCKIIVNNEICVAPNGAQYPISQFEPSAIQETPHIKAEQKNSSEFSFFLENVSSYILENYFYMIWKSPYEIYVEHKEKKFQLLMRYDLIPNENQLNMINNFYEQIRSNHHILDIRFNDQFILFTNRGKGDGKGIFR